MNKLLNSRNRFKEAPWFNPDQKVTVGGLGSIGSWLTLFMGKLVNTIYVYDFDNVEEHNMSGQLYGKSQVGQSKADATINTADSLNPSTSIIKRGKFKEGSPVTEICFSCFDNMEARKNMFYSWKKHESGVFIDGRLTAEELWVYGVTPDKADKYESEYLLDDSDFDELPCSFKSTTHISSMCASHMVVLFTNWYSNRDFEMRIFPFEVTYNAAMSLQKNNM